MAKHTHINIFAEQLQSDIFKFNKRSGFFLIFNKFSKLKVFSNK